MTAIKVTTLQRAFKTGPREEALPPTACSRVAAYAAHARTHARARGGGSPAIGGTDRRISSGLAAGRDGWGQGYY